MRNLNGTMLVGLAAFAAKVATASPTVMSVAMTQQRGGGPVTITYTLTDAPAVVTLDVQTNYTENAVEKWASIGGEHICNAQGDVWRKVGSSGEFNGTITWRPDMSWKDEDGNGFRIDGTTQKARAVVTAWRLDNTPDYMVVDITAGAQQNSQRYYPSVDFLPGFELGQTGAVTNNPIYKTSSLLMRKIMAKDVTWTMGSTAFETSRGEDEWTHAVTLANNYYIGVFEITQSQWANVTGAMGYTRYTNALYRATRPQDFVCYNEIRCKTANGRGAAVGGLWPNAPYEGSFLDLLRGRTGLDFDLPSEAEWEFACRAGNGDTKWNDGSQVQNVADNKADENLNRLGRNIRCGLSQSSTGYNSETLLAATPDEGGTAIVGSYMPNSWGLYDMHGNVREWCLDWYEAGITNFNGRVNVDVSNPANTLSGADGGARVLRGGGEFSVARLCRSATRHSYDPAKGIYRWSGGAFGFRVVCRAGLE